MKKPAILQVTSIDLHKFDSHIPKTDYVNCIFSQSFLPTVNEPTRVTDTSATLINNIVTNANLQNSISSIIYADISDHFPVFLQTHLLMEPAVKPCFICKSNFTEDAKLRFIQSPHETNWGETLGVNNDLINF